METKTTDGILTVGELRRILSAVDDSTQVTIATDGWWLNVESVEIPTGDNSPTVIFYTADTFDPRQI